MEFLDEFDIFFCDGTCFLSFILNKPRRMLHKFNPKVIGWSFEHQSTGTVAAGVSFTGGVKGSAVPKKRFCSHADFEFLV